MKLASLETITGQIFDHKYKSSIVQFIDDIDSAWAQMAHLKPSEHLNNEQKICKFTNKIAKSGYALHASNAKLQLDRKTWEGFIQNLKMLLQCTEHGLVANSCRAHKSHSQHKQTSELDPSDEESSMILNMCTDPSWDDHSMMNACCDDMSTPPKAWVFMHKLNPDFLCHFVKA